MTLFCLRKCQKCRDTQTKYSSILPTWNLSYLHRIIQWNIFEFIIERFDYSFFGGNFTHTETGIKLCSCILITKIYRCNCWVCFSGPDHIPDQEVGAVAMEKQGLTPDHAAGIILSLNKLFMCWLLFHYLLMCWGYILWVILNSSCHTRMILKWFTTFLVHLTQRLLCAFAINWNLLSLYGKIFTFQSSLMQQHGQLEPNFAGMRF